MNCCMVDIYWLKQAFGGDILENFGIKQTDICQFWESWERAKDEELTGN